MLGVLSIFPRGVEYIAQGGNARDDWPVFFVFVPDSLTRNRDDRIQNKAWRQG